MSVVVLLLAVAFVAWCAYDCGYDSGWFAGRCGDFREGSGTGSDKALARPDARASSVTPTATEHDSDG